MKKEEETVEFSMIREAASDLWPAALSPEFLSGMAGEPLRRVGDILTLHDLNALLLPGLASVGLAAECIALPEDNVALLRLVKERLRYGVLVPVVGFLPNPPAPFPTSFAALTGKGESSALCDFRARPSPPAPLPGRERGDNPESVDSPFRVSAPLPNPPLQRREGRVGEGDGGVGHPDAGDLSLSTIAQIIRVEPGETKRDFRFVCRDANGVETVGNTETLREKFTHTIRLRKGSGSGVRRAVRRDALLRWLAFAAAFPERVVTTDEQDQHRRDKIVFFLSELRRRRHDSVANRLGWAIQDFAHGDITGGLYWLREAVLRELHLPPAAERALLAPEDRSLDDLERRELLYLARAGTRDMKVLAVRRLRTETTAPDAAATCQQLQFDTDAWVRAASGR